MVPALPCKCSATGLLLQLEGGVHIMGWAGPALITSLPDSVAGCSHQLQVLARHWPCCQVAVNQVDGQEQGLRHQLRAEQQQAGNTTTRQNVLMPLIIAAWHPTGQLLCAGALMDWQGL